MPGEAATWNVFDLTGRHLARIDLPGRSRLIRLGEEEVLVVVEDDLRVERLELYRIDTPGGGRMDRLSARITSSAQPRAAAALLLAGSPPATPLRSNDPLPGLLQEWKNANAR